MTEDDALGRALGAGGEQHRGRRVGRDAGAGQAMGAAGVEPAAQLGGRADAGADVFEPDEADPPGHALDDGGQLGAGDEVA